MKSPRLLLATAALIVPFTSFAATPAFSVGQVTTRSAIVDARAVLNAHLSEPAETCSFFVDGKKIKSMTVRDTLATTWYQFPDVKTYQVHIECTTAGGIVGSGTPVSIVAVAQNTNARPGDLVKMACPVRTGANHPCTTVYYYGLDGRRHAFPTERVFKTWYKDFSNVVVLSPVALSDISLGRNVIHKPASKLVKFSTSTVYAVAYGGELRPIASEEIAKTIFGMDWASQIEGVNDVFFSSYRIGRSIESSRDFEATKVRSSADTIDDVL